MGVAGAVEGTPSGPVDRCVTMDQLVAASRGVDEARLVRKLDVHLIPLIMAVYLFSFIDRVNMGNARLYSLEADLSLSSAQFQVAVSVFFIPYMLFEVPSNLVLKLFTPRRWIASMTVSWGIVATLMGLVDSYGSFGGFMWRSLGLIRCFTVRI